MFRLNLGNVQFDAPHDWRFYPQPHLIVAAPPSRAGVLQITLGFREATNIPHTHEDCWTAALAFAGQITEPQTTDSFRAMIDDLPLGGASFLSREDFFRLWYHYTRQGLVIASYTVKAQRLYDAPVRHALAECERIVRSIVLPPLTV